MNKKIGKLLLAIIICVTVTGISAYTVSSLSRMGSRGTEVRNIQTRLKNWGYYNGGVDGIYGTKTRDAVKLFQKKNGLIR